MRLNPGGAHGSGQFNFLYGKLVQARIYEERYRIIHEYVRSYMDETLLNAEYDQLRVRAKIEYMEVPDKADWLVQRVLPSIVSCAEREFERFKMSFDYDSSDSSNSSHGNEQVFIRCEDIRSSYPNIGIVKPGLIEFSRSVMETSRIRRPN